MNPIPDNDDDVFLIDERATGTEAAQRWKLLVVDDEPDVHAITRVVLGDIRYDGGDLDILSAYSAAEARCLLHGHEDIALILLDVVMEETDSGLELVRYVREVLANALVRIVLRTGQPGYAPEREVVMRYDINDYKEKTELTAQKLFTTVVSSLRAYQHLVRLERQRLGLEHIVRANRELYGRLESSDFCAGALAFLAALAGAGSGLMFRDRGDHREVLAEINGGLDPDPLLAQGRLSGSFPVWSGHGAVAVALPSRSGIPAYACLDGIATDTGEIAPLLDVFAEAISVALDNVLLLGHLQDAQKAMVYAFARMAEFRDADTGRHVRRVEQLVRAIALRLRDTDEFACLRDDHYREQLALASILHDVGKIGVPDAVLNKPGDLDPVERGMMHQHAAIGAEILAEAANMVPGMSYLSLAAEIAANHHESADGSGYPEHKKLDGIPLAARIVAVADVFDALVSKRPYKDEWPVDKAIGLLRSEAGRRFDPLVVRALEEVLAPPRA